MSTFAIWQTYVPHFNIVSEPQSAVNPRVKSQSKPTPNAHKDPYPDTPESFHHTASIIFATLKRFPEALHAVLDALRPFAPLPRGVPA